jgi:2-polyprenyl-3-methyl-5-hydroxy-6-metoxy-1,4-benzoquinol methylase
MMYGSEKTDPVVKYYDQTLAVTSSGDIAWFVNQAQVAGGRVLDLACGTGRIAIPLAEAGLEVTAVDSSPGMLERFRAKLSSLPESVQSRITVQQGRMQAFHVPGPFSTVVCCDAFFHNLTVDDQMNCLQCVASHLIPGGRFVFNIPNPTIPFLSYAASPEAKEFKKRDEYTLDDGTGTVLVEQAQEADLFEQTITTRLRFTKHDADRTRVEIEESAWVTRFTFRYEAIHLLYRCEFEIESLTGNYRGAPVSENSQLVFITRLRDNQKNL